MSLSESVILIFTTSPSTDVILQVPLSTSGPIPQGFISHFIMPCEHMSLVTHGIATTKFLMLLWVIGFRVRQMPLRVNVPSLNLYPCFQIVFNVSFVS
jgi:hypothetical protein